MTKIRSFACPLALLGITIVTPVWAQDSVADFGHLVWRDQVHVFTSPVHIKKRDWTWLLPVAGVTAFLFATDQRNMSERIHTNAEARDRSLDFSNVGLGSLAAVPSFYAWQGWRNRDGYEQETGWLAARAVADTLIASEGLRLITRRERPTASGSANFFTSGPADSAFPSMHAASAWALASVVAHRYPGWLTDLMVYGLAGGVSASRVIGREHSPSDVFVGSALGFLIGKYVAGTGSQRRTWNWMDASRYSPAGAKQTTGRDGGTAGPSGSTYVPMDSWIYGALDRLASLGYIPSQMAGLRPWTRAECLRQTREAQSRIPPPGAPTPAIDSQATLRATALPTEAEDLVTALQKEFANDSDAPAIVLQSVYARNGVIAGPVLNNSYHFGQTWINDYGRPFGRGWNSDDGFIVNARSGRFYVHVQGEVQHAPGTPPLSLPVRQTLAGLDGLPVVQAAQPSVDTNRFRTIEAYAGFQVGDLDFSVGKQTLYWGPTYDAPLSYSTNAEPTKNLKVSTAHPVHLGPLGEVRVEFVMGKLGGDIYTWRPWFNGVKFSFKLTKDLEMGFTRTSILWGLGHPITLGSLITNFTSTISPPGSSEGLYNAKDPGARQGGFDFRYRVPGLANWLTLYADSYCHDDPSPLAAPRRAAINPGIYLSHIPGVPKLDFRVEDPSTIPMDEAWDRYGGNFNYWNNQYRSGPTNYGTLIGSWVGRDARTQEGWLGYALSPRTRIELSARHLKGSSNFLPGGATQSDIALKASYQLDRQWNVGLFAQYENFLIPILGPRNSNVSSWVQLTWEPNLVLLGKGTKQ
jgi:membrane-associated phospholipid phosphatase